MGFEDRPAGNEKLVTVKHALPNIGEGRGGSVETMPSTVEVNGQEVITLCHQFPNRADPLTAKHLDINRRIGRLFHTMRRRARGRRLGVVLPSFPHVPGPGIISTVVVEYGV